MEADIDVYDSNEPSGAVNRADQLNLSSASADTSIDQLPPVKRKENNVLEYFILVESTGKFKCSICAKVREFLWHYMMPGFLCSSRGSRFISLGRDTSRTFTQTQTSATTLVSATEYLNTCFHLSWHGNSHQRRTTITQQTKIHFNEAAVQSIIDDGHAFGISRRDGLYRFLSTVTTGYYGQSRTTVRRHFGKLYRERPA